MPDSFNLYKNEFVHRGWGEINTAQKSEDKLIEVLTSWGQHPDCTDPDLMGSRVFLQTADINELAKLILEAGFRIGGPS